MNHVCVKGWIEGDMCARIKLVRVVDVVKEETRKKGTGVGKGKGKGREKGEWKGKRGKGGWFSSAVDIFQRNPKIKSLNYILV